MTDEERYNGFAFPKKSLELFQNVWQQMRLVMVLYINKYAMNAESAICILWFKRATHGPIEWLSLRRSSHRPIWQHSYGLHVCDRVTAFEHGHSTVWVPIILWELETRVECSEMTDDISLQGNFKSVPDACLVCNMDLTSLNDGLISYLFPVKTWDAITQYLWTPE